MNVEIISVGTELLLGDILNTNAQFLSRELAAVGINVYNQFTVGDNIDRVKRCLDFAFEKSNTVILTGGLGPTDDDITKEAAAGYFNQELLFDSKQWDIIVDRFIKYGRSVDKIPENNKKQACFTSNAVILPNYNGTAPGAIFSKDDKRIIILPGPPNEMKPIFKKEVLPILSNGHGTTIKSKYIRFYGIGESALEIELKDILDKQSNPTIALYAKEGEVLVRVSAKSDSEEDADFLLNKVTEEIKNTCGEYIYLIGGEDISSSQTELDSVVSKLLVDMNKKIAVAESCTGGLISSSLINYPGISSVFLEGCVTYSNEAKMSRLGVNNDTLEKFGAVSHETAVEMARGIAKNLGAEIGISTTGIAGPDGGSLDKPVGLVYIGVYIDNREFSYKRNFGGDRKKIRERATREALNILRMHLLGTI